MERMNKRENEQEEEWARQRKSKRMNEQDREWRKIERETKRVKKIDRDREQRDREWETKNRERDQPIHKITVCVYIYLNGWWQIYLSQECDMDGRFGSKKGYIQITVTQLQYEA